MFVRSLVLQLLLALCPNSTSFSIQSFHIALSDRSSTFVAFGFVFPVGALDVCWQQVLVVAFQLSLNQVRMCGPVPPCFQPAPTYTHQEARDLQFSKPVGLAHQEDVTPGMSPPQMIENHQNNRLHSRVPEEGLRIRPVP